MILLHFREISGGTLLDFSIKRYSNLSFLLQNMRTRKPSDNVRKSITSLKKFRKLLKNYLLKRKIINTSMFLTVPIALLQVLLSRIVSLAWKPIFYDKPKSKKKEVLKKYELNRCCNNNNNADNNSNTTYPYNFNSFSKHLFFLNTVWIRTCTIRTNNVVWTLM